MKPYETKWNKMEPKELIWNIKNETIWNYLTQFEK